MNAPFDGLTDEAAKMLTEVFLTASGAELTIESRPAGHWPFHQNIPARRWRVTLVRRGRIWAFDYYTGVGLLLHMMCCPFSRNGNRPHSTNGWPRRG